MCRIFKSDDYKFKFGFELENQATKDEQEEPKLHHL